jgi:hypothetical protein
MSEIQNVPQETTMAGGDGPTPKTTMAGGDGPTPMEPENAPTQDSTEVPAATPSQSNPSPTPIPTEVPITPDPAAPVKLRPKAVANQEYVGLAGQLGDIQFRIMLLEAHKGQVIERLATVNGELGEINKLEADKRQRDLENHDRQVIENYKAAEEKRLRKGAAAQVTGKA